MKAFSLAKVMEAVSLRLLERPLGRELTGPAKPRCIALRRIMKGKTRAESPSVSRMGLLIDTVPLPRP